MRRNNLTVAAPILSLVLLFAAPTTAAQVEVRDEDYKVYSAILSATNWIGKARVHLIIRTTLTSEGVVGIPGIDDRSTLLKKLAPLSDEVLNDYEQVNQSEFNLSDKFKLKPRLLLIDERETHGIFAWHAVDGWNHFHKRFPDSDGFTKFSRVGFDANKSLALVYVSYSCDRRCAEGGYYLLEKGNHGWKVTSKYAVWVS